MLLEARKRVSGKEPAIVYYSESNHAGIQGIVSNKLSEIFGKPSIMLADVGDGMVFGSGRAGLVLHLQAALEKLNEKKPELLVSLLS